MTQQSDEQAWQRKLRLLRWTIFLLPTLLVGLAAYGYLRFEAERFTPPEGYVFPREPVLIGEYQFEVLKGRRNYRSRVGQTQIWCASFSYYAGTWAQSDGYSDCRREELNGKQVEVHRVKVPMENKEVGPVVIRILADGQTYLDLSDAEIRKLWIRDTHQDALLFIWKAWLIASGLFWSLSLYVVKKLYRRRRK